MCRFVSHDFHVHEGIVQCTGLRGPRVTGAGFHVGSGANPVGARLARCRRRLAVRYRNATNPRPIPLGIGLLCPIQREMGDDLAACAMAEELKPEQDWNSRFPDRLNLPL